METLRYVILGALALVFLSSANCAERPKPTPQPSPSQIRSDSDRFFEKMRAEERERQGVAPPR